VYLIRVHREKETCAPACWNATGYDCSCSCGGMNHGSQSGEGYLVIGDTLAVRWGDTFESCTLLRPGG
jgi:hypothetical protein